MALKKYRPITPAMRDLQLIDRKELFSGRPWQSLTKARSSTGGRNNLGRVTLRARGGGHKRHLRKIDFVRREFLDKPGKVERIEYDPGRTAFIALINYDIEGDRHLGRRYILAPQKLKVNDRVISSESQVETRPGNSMPLAVVPVGTLVHNIELKPGKGGQMTRAAGQFAQVVGRDDDYVLLRFSSGEIRRVLSAGMATCGTVSNADHSNQVFGKAGRSRWKGRRPRVRGVAKNPHDHPMGGGEGKTSGGRNPVSPTGVPAKGFRTRKNKGSDRLVVRSRHKR